MAPQGDDPGTRRSLLLSLGGAGSVSAVGAIRSAIDDRDDDGIPDRTKRSAAFYRRMESIFGPDQFEGLAVGRTDLLLDVRYIGDAQVTPATKRTIVELFRDHGIYAQWLDYPGRYEQEAVAAQYGTTVKDLLWGRGSFYAREVEPELRNVALQLLVVPGVTNSGYEGRIYSHWMDTTGGGVDGYVNGFSVGNRAVVADRDDRLEEARLVLHELAHLALCHDTDPRNTGVMGTGEEVDLLAREWAQLRDGLSNVRDRTGYDILARPCLWRENLSAVLD